MSAIEGLRQKALSLDAADTLKDLRDAFHLPEGLIYLDGNSLGMMPKASRQRVQEVLEQEWSEGLIDSWSKAGWFRMPITVGDKIARIIGAKSGEVAVGDSTSVNLFKALSAALHIRPQRKSILVEAKNFPTDTYMAQGLAELLSEVRVAYFQADNLEAALTSDVAVVLASHVDYRTAHVHDMAAMTRAVQANGALMLWDLSHTTGAVACDLTDAEADFAVGCTYKYLNGGPGAPAFMWVHPRHITDLKQPLSGWMGHADPFAFSRDYQPAEGVRRLVCGTPQILSLASLEAALDLWEGISLPALWSKSQIMTSFFIEAVETLCAGHELELISPKVSAERGSHVSFDAPEGGYEIMQALKARGVIGDFRTPATMRFGFAPLYLSFDEVLKAAEHLMDILDNRSWDDDQFRVRGDIT